MGLVLASHVALLVVILSPPSRLRPRAGDPTPRSRDGALRVELLLPHTIAHRAPRTVPVALGRPRPAHPPRAPATRPSVQRVAESGRPIARPAPPATASTAATYIAGGGFQARLRQAQSGPAKPRLPGGHRYMVTGFDFVPVEQQSIQGKVNKIGWLFGSYDPVCKDLALEQTRSREQQIADGYTRADLQRIAREHHCN